MPVSVTMPRLGESVTEGTITRWLKQEGDRVEADEPLLEVSTDKVDTEIPSPAAGVLTRIVVHEDETAEVGAELAVIGDSADASGGDSSGDTQSGDTQSGDTESGDTESGDAKSGDTQSGDTDRGDADGREAESGDTDRGDTDRGEQPREEPAEEHEEPAAQESSPAAGGD